MVQWLTMEETELKVPGLCRPNHAPSANVTCIQGRAVSFPRKAVFERPCGLFGLAMACVRVL